jgi:hypothetical protein
MTTHVTAVDHPSRRLVVALPDTYGAARERYESLVPGELITLLGGAMPPQLGTEVTA